MASGFERKRKRRSDKDHSAGLATFLRLPRFDDASAGKIITTRALAKIAENLEHSTWWPRPGGQRQPDNAFARAGKRARYCENGKILAGGSGACLDIATDFDGQQSGQESRRFCPPQRQ